MKTMDKIKEEPYFKILKYCNENNPKTLSIISQDTKMAYGTVWNYMKSMIKRGLIEKDNNFHLTRKGYDLYNMLKDI